MIKARTVGGDIKPGKVGKLEAQVLAQRRQVQVVQRLLLDLRRDAELFQSPDAGRSANAPRPVSPMLLSIPLTGLYY